MKVWGLESEVDVVVGPGGAGTVGGTRMLMEIRPPDDPPPGRSMGFTHSRVPGKAGPGRWGPGRVLHCALPNVPAAANWTSANIKVVARRSAWHPSE